MYLKELTIRRNNALKRQCKILEEDGSIQIKIVYHAVLKFKKRHQKLMGNTGIILNNKNIVK